MATDFRVPDLGENVESGDIVNVLVKEGDEIQADQSVMEIETGKAVVELPCPVGGRITKVHVHKGSKVKVGDALLTLESASAAASKPAVAAASAAKPSPKPAKEAPPEPPAAAAQKPAKAETPPPEPAAPEPAPKQPAAKPRPAAAQAPAEKPPSGKTPPAGPATRRLARELGVDLANVVGSGPHGRITEEDVKAAVREHATAARPATATPSVPLPAGQDDRDSWGAVRRAPLTAIRKTIAVNMARSSATIPHVTNFDDADITELERIRKGGLTDYVGSDIKLTMMAFVMKAVAQSLKLHPMLNASIDLEGEQVIYKQYVNIGVAVDTERGLVVPVVREVDQMTIPRIAQALTTVAEQARKASFTLADLKGATFTISNLGAVGGIYSTPIINPPEVAVLLVGRSRKLPVVMEDDKIETRLMMPLSLSYDHRLVDGAAAARFLNEVINYLKVPGRLLLAP